MAESFYQAKRNASVLLPGFVGARPTSQPSEQSAASSEGRQPGQQHASVQGAVHDTAIGHGRSFGSGDIAMS